MINAFRTAMGVCALLVVAPVVASPVIDSAIVKPRIWNDDPLSVFTSTNLYPAGPIWMDEQDLSHGGWANRHSLRLSDNGGVTESVFLNNDGFALFADVTLTGTAHSEGGLNVAPWWSKDVDGLLMINTETGEVAAWGGRLPFYSFTVNHGLTYTKGQTVRLGLVYEPNSLTQSDPGTIQYFYTHGGTTYTSGALNFDQGNPAEDPPYGLWGILNDARVGGYFMPKVNLNDPGNWGHAEFANIVYTPEPAALALLGPGAVLLRRGRPGSRA